MLLRYRIVFYTGDVFDAVDRSLAFVRRAGIGLINLSAFRQDIDNSRIVIEIETTDEDSVQVLLNRLHVGVGLLDISHEKLATVSHAIDRRLQEFVKH